MGACWHHPECPTGFSTSTSRQDALCSLRHGWENSALGSHPSPHGRETLCSASLPGAGLAPHRRGSGASSLLQHPHPSFYLLSSSPSGRSHQQEPPPSTHSTSLLFSHHAAQAPEVFLGASFPVCQCCNRGRGACHRGLMPYGRCKQHFPHIPTCPSAAGWIQSARRMA